MAKENFLIGMVLHMKENGKMISSMGKVERYGPMGQSILAHITMVQKMDLEYLNGEEEMFILEIL
jgi:hypothetical protein